MISDSLSIQFFYVFYHRVQGVVFFFFFSSRRRHTRFDCDWNSDVCSSDLEQKWIRRDKLARGDAKSGVDGDPRLASAELGKAFLDIKVAAAVAQIRTLVGKR